jgi:translation initiation factor IF-1
MVNNQDDLSAIGVVTEALPNAMFRVTLEGGKEVLTYLAGKMHINKIRVLVGDKVKVQLDQYSERGRIVKRL